MSTGFRVRCALGCSVRLASSRLVLLPVGFGVRCAGRGRGRIGDSGRRSGKIGRFFVLPVFGALESFLCYGVRLVVGLVVGGIFGADITGHSLVKFLRAFSGLFVRACNVRFIYGRGGACIICDRLALCFSMPGSGCFVVQLCASGFVIVAGRYLSYGLPALAAIDGGSVLRGIAVGGTHVSSSFLYIRVPDGVIFQLRGAVKLFPDGHTFLHPIPNRVNHPIGVRPVQGG